ncbi:MAG: tetratricopeptide repeat protein [Smithella sp.]
MFKYFKSEHIILVILGLLGPLVGLQLKAIFDLFGMGDWYEENTLLALLLFILSITIFIILTIYLSHKKKNDKSEEFPFELIDLDKFADKLVVSKTLTEVSNPYINRDRNLLNDPKVDTGNRRILIVGRAETGKTREAFKIIKEEIFKGNDPRIILYPKSGHIPYNFSEQKIPHELTNMATVLFYDELSNIYPSQNEKNPDSIGPQDQLKKVIEVLQEKTNQFHFVATCRHENFDKMGKVNYKTDSFWKSFEIYELGNMEEAFERQMIENLISIYSITMNNQAIDRILEINKGYSCESIVTYMKLRSGKEITENEIKWDFKQKAYESWKVSTFDILKKKNPHIEEIYKIFAFLSMTLHIPISYKLLYLLGKNRLRNSGKWFFAGRAVSNTLEFLEQKKAIDVHDGIIELPDYQLDGIEEIDFDEQINVMKNIRGIVNSYGVQISAAILDKAYMLQVDNLLNDSIERYTQALFFNPKNAAAYINRGSAYGEKGDYDLAIKDYKKVVEEIDPQNALAYINRGNAYGKKGDYDLAMKDFTKVVEEIDPQNIRAYINRGTAHGEKGDYNLAIDDFTKVVEEIDPQNALAYFNRGTAYAMKGITYMVIAIKDFTKVVEELDPQNVSAYINRGNAYGKKGDYDLAIKDFTKVVEEIDPQNTLAYFNRGCIYSNIKKYDLAIDDYTKVVEEIDPQNIRAYINRGTAHGEKGDYNLAMKDFTKVVEEIDPQNVDAYYNRGCIYSNIKKYDLAIDDYTKAIKFDPQNTSAYVNLGNAYSTKGITYNTIAIYTYKKAIELDPQNVLAYLNLGIAYVKKENHDLAIDNFTKAIELDPQNVGAYVNRGNAYKAKGEIKMANQDYTKAKELNT